MSREVKKMKDYEITEMHTTQQFAIELLSYIGFLLRDINKTNEEKHGEILHKISIDICELCKDIRVLTKELGTMKWTEKK